MYRFIAAVSIIVIEGGVFAHAKYRRKRRPLYSLFFFFFFPRWRINDFVEYHRYDDIVTVESRRKTRVRINSLLSFPFFYLVLFARRRIAMDGGGRVRRIFEVESELELRNP